MAKRRNAEEEITCVAVPLEQEQRKAIVDAAFRTFELVIASTDPRVTPEDIAAAKAVWLSAVRRAEQAKPGEVMAVAEIVETVSNPRIKHAGKSKWVVETNEGRVLGRHRTHRSAEAQVRAISWRESGARENPRRNPPTYEESHWGEQPAGSTALAVPEARDNRELVAYGVLVSVTYRTVKGGDVGKTDYVHSFKRERPLLAYGDVDGRLFVAGGTYQCTSRGIVG